MLSSPFVDKVFGWMEASIAADTVSRLNYYFFGWIVIVGCVIIGIFQNWAGLDILCWLPSDYKQENILAVLAEKCYYGSLEFKKIIDSGVNYATINTIAHYPYILSNLLTFFAILLFIQLFWIILVRRAGSIEAWFVMVVREYGVKINPENSDLEELCSTYKSLFRNMNSRLIWSRIFIQLLYIAAGISEIIYLNNLISSQVWSWWAFMALGHIFLGSDYDYYFPLEVWCNTSYRSLGNTRPIQMNCTLGLNVWYERIATTVWLYLVPLTIVNIIYFIYLLCLICSPYCQMWAMTDIIKQPSKAKSESFQKFVRRIGPDGVYLLSQIERTTTADYASRVTKALFQSFNDEPAPPAPEV